MPWRFVSLTQPSRAQSKRARVAKKKQHVTHLKEVKLRPKIEEHDYQFKLRHAVRFLVRGRHAVHCGQLVRDEVDQRGLGGKKGVEQIGVLQAVRFSHQAHRLWVAPKGDRTRV